MALQVKRRLREYRGAGAFKTEIATAFAQVTLSNVSNYYTRCILNFDKELKEPGGRAGPLTLAALVHVQYSTCFARTSSMKRISTCRKSEIRPKL